MTSNPATIQNFYILTVGVAGFLLPVMQAILLFITEKSFNKFEATRQELVGHYKKQGYVLSTCLAYLVIQPVFLMLELWIFAKVAVIAFVLIAIIFRIRLLHDTGLWITMFSSKFIPQNRSAIYKYYRACRNNNLSQLISAAFLAMILFLPYFLEQALAYSVLLTLVYVVISITLLLNNPASLQHEILKIENTGYEMSQQEDAWTEEKVEQEKKLLASYLSKNNFYEAIKDLKIDKSKLFSYSINWFIKKEDGEFWCNIWIDDLGINNIGELRDRIETIAKDEFIYLFKAKTDVNSFVLSFHFKIGDTQRNAFFRSNKNEIDRLKIKQPKEFVKGIKNKLYDEVLL